MNFKTVNAITPKGRLKITSNLETFFNNWSSYAVAARRRVLKKYICAVNYEIIFPNTTDKITAKKT